MSLDEFFEDPTEQSRVKAAIVSKYFDAWAKVMKPRAREYGNGNIAYIDLFAGPGRYATGDPSTPVLILQKAIDDPDLRVMLHTIFNDKDPQLIAALETTIRGIPGIEQLKHRPLVVGLEVDTEVAKVFGSTGTIPTLFFFDPWGYKGLSRELIDSALRGWGCDCIFFFNYNRINPGLSNPMVQEHMAALFGAEEAHVLRDKVEGLAPSDREACIIEALCQMLMQNRTRFVLPFCFKNDTGSRTSHHLIFVSKNVLGYTIMKDIMWRESSSHNQGVATFQYCPADQRCPTLFELLRPLDDLEGMLLQKFADKTLRMKQVFDQHHVGLPFVSPNYKEVLKQLEAKGTIRCEPSGSARKEGTFGDKVLVTFPPRGGSLGKIKH